MSPAGGGRGWCLLNNATISHFTIRQTLKPPPSLRDTSAGGGYGGHFLNVSDWRKDCVAMFYIQSMTFIMSPAGGGRGWCLLNNATISHFTIRQTLKPPPSLRDTSASGGYERAFSECLRQAKRLRRNVVYSRHDIHHVPRWRGQGVVSFNDAVIHICSIRQTLKPPPSLRDTSASGGYGGQNPLDT